MRSADTTGDARGLGSRDTRAVERIAEKKRVTTPRAPQDGDKEEE